MILNSNRKVYGTFSGLTCAFLLLLASHVVAHAQSLPTGSIIERVTCDTDKDQSYALYLPSNYDPQKKWPIIYAFDPDARGNLPVTLFMEAAEKYGYMVAGSYDSQNGIGSNELKRAVSSMIADTRKRLSIDERRVYATGFSGGARVAIRVASSCPGCVAGVIACGAGFPTDLKPSSTTAFALFGTVGLYDFNYPELKRLDERLESLKVPHYLANFDGFHQWASSQLMVDAVEWMEIQAIRSGRRIRDDTLVEAIWKKRIAQAPLSETTAANLQTYRLYSAIAADFDGIKDVSQFHKRSVSLRESREVKQAIKEEREEIREQYEISGRLIDLGTQALTNPTEHARAMNEVKNTVVGLRKIIETAPNTSEARVARRVLFQVTAQTYEAAMYNYLPNREFKTAIVNLEVAEIVAPKGAQIPYELARAYSRIGEKKSALDALRRAIAKGWNDRAGISKQKDFDSIRNEEEFKLLLNGINNASQGQ